MIIPRFHIEQTLAAHGYRGVCGLDEAGRGAWAGPLVAAAVILPRRINRVRDSKLLTAPRRRFLARLIKRAAVAWSVGIVEVAEINQFGLAWAAHEVFRRAIKTLTLSPDHLLVDYLRIKGVKIPQISIVDGDQMVTSIAAASIIAKTHRDALMRQLGHQRGIYCYRFAYNKGYGTPSHQAAIKKHGLTPHHRRYSLTAKTSVPSLVG